MELGCGVLELFPSNLEKQGDLQVKPHDIFSSFFFLIRGFCSRRRVNECKVVLVKCPEVH